MERLVESYVGCAGDFYQSTDWIGKAIVLVDSIGESRLSTRVVQMQRWSTMLCLHMDGGINKEKGWGDQLSG